AATLLQRSRRGEVDLGQPGAGAGYAARMWMPGSLGALLEKDLRMTWRDPALKATLFIGLVGPLLFLVFLSQTGAGGGAGKAFLLLATFVGVSAFGSNAFGLERRGIALLLGFPVERWRILVGKNAGAILLRLPGLVVLLAAGVVLAPLPLERPWLWAVTLPLALAGALSVYAMLVTAASRLLERREPELMERILGEE